MIKDTLDRQLKEQQLRKQREVQEKQQFDQILLATAKAQLDQEQVKMSEMKNKVYEQKLMRDMQLVEAKVKKTSDIKNQREHEIEFASKLKNEIEEEKRVKMEKRRVEREQAWKIINENQVKQQQKVQAKVQEKERDNKMLQDYNKLLEEQDQKRAQEWAKRENRI